MGINVISASTADVRMPAGSAITAGDLVINSEGAAVKASTALSIAQQNNTTTGLQAIYPVTSYGGNYGDASNYALRNICEAGDGSILQVFTGNGTISSTGVQLVTRSLAGAVASTAVAVSSAASCICPRIKQVSSGTVVIAWVEVAVLKFAIYNNNGTVATSTATVTSLPNGASPYWNMSVLANGDIVFAYNKITSLNTTFARYNSSGVLQGSEVIVESAANTTGGICVLPQTGGGFIVYYYRSAAAVNWNFARYNASGVLQGTLTTVSTGSPAAMSYGEFDHLAIELSNGSIVFQWNATAHNHSIYTSAGVFVTTVVTDPRSPTLNNAWGLLPSPSGGFATFTNTGTTLLFRLFNSSGQVLNTYDFGMVAASGGLVASRTTQGYCVLSSYFDGDTGYSAQLASMSAIGANIGSIITVSPNATSANRGLCLVRHSSGPQLIGFKNTGATGYQEFAVYNPDKTSVIGVALESVSVGAICRVSTKGTYTINQALTGGSFDQRTATVPGTKGSVAGSTAVLYGMI